jgi:DNA-binding MarR family transcriptional regulator
MLSSTTKDVKLVVLGGALWRHALEYELKGNWSKMYEPQVTEAFAEERLNLGHLNQHLGYFVRRLQITIFKDFIRELAPMRVGPAQYSVLLLIEANPGSSQAAIGRALGIERARLARLLHDLEERLWIERRSASSDARSHALFLSREGVKALARSKKLAARHEAHITELLGAKRTSALLQLLSTAGTKLNSPA